jgi:uncharacterized protein
MRDHVEPGDRHGARREDRELTVRALSPADYTRIPWKNGGGVSVTIAGEQLPGAAAGDWSGLIWQLSRTDIVTPAPFSDLTGFERLQTVVSGEGLFLDTPTATIDLSRPFSVARYDGGTPIVSRLARGPVGVVNLIARRDAARIAMAVVHAGEGYSAVKGHHVIHAPAEAAMVLAGDTRHALPPDHSLAMDGPLDLTCQAGLVIACTIQRITVL